MPARLDWLLMRYAPEDPHLLPGGILAHGDVFSRIIVASPPTHVLRYIAWLQTIADVIGFLSATYFVLGLKAYLKMRINLPGSIPGRSMLILGAITLMPPALLGIVNLRCMATVDTMLNLEHPFLRRSDTFKTARYTLSRRSTLSARLPLAFPIGMDTTKALFILLSFRQ